MTDSPTSVLPEAASAPFFEGCAAGKLVLQQCRTCRSWCWPVAVICPVCGSEGLDWRQASGRGVIYSYSTVHRAFSPGYADRVPYRVVIVDLDEGLRVTTNIVDADHDRVCIGARVKVRFAQAGGTAYPVFAISGTS